MTLNDRIVFALIVFGLLSIGAVIGVAATLALGL